LVLKSQHEINCNRRGGGLLLSNNFEYAD